MSLKETFAGLPDAALIEVSLTVSRKQQTAFFRELSGEEMESILEPLRDDEGSIPKQRNREFRNKVIAASLCEADGSPVISAEMTSKLPNALYVQLQRHAMGINGLLAESDDPKA